MQAFRLTVRQALSIVSARRAEFRYSRRTRFVVRSKGFPFLTFRVVGRLPRGFTFRSSGAGTATLTASPIRWEIGRRFTIRITAIGGVPNAGSAGARLFRAAAQREPTGRHLDLKPDA